MWVGEVGVGVGGEGGGGGVSGDRDEGEGEDENERGVQAIVNISRVEKKMHFTKLVSDVCV